MSHILYIVIIIIYYVSISFILSFLASQNRSFSLEPSTPGHRTEDDSIDRCADRNTNKGTIQSTTKRHRHDSSIIDAMIRQISNRASLCVEFMKTMASKYEKEDNIFLFIGRKYQGFSRPKPKTG